MVAPSHLKSFQALEAAVRVGSLKGAADALAITPAAVGQRIKALEDYLGVDLLARGRSGLAPTPALTAALTHVRAAFRELEAASEILDLQRGHEIHIAAMSDFVEFWLRPRIERFRAEHPNMLFCINGEGDAPLRLGVVDCEISFAAPATGANTETLFHDYVAPLTSRANVKRISTRAKRERLEGFPLLHLDFYKDDPAVPNWAAWSVKHRVRRTAPERGMRFQRIAPVIEAVRADAGVTICGLALLRDPFEANELALPFPIATGAWTAHAFQARFRADAASRPQVRRFREWLRKEAEATRDWLGTIAPATG